MQTVKLVEKRLVPLEARENKGIPIREGVYLRGA